MRLNSKKLLFVGVFALTASFTFAQVVEPTDSTKVEQDENVSLGETLIVGKGVIDVSENRKTPVASTVITREEILDKGVGNVEFPELFCSHVVKKASFSASVIFASNLKAVEIGIFEFNDRFSETDG